MEKRIMDMYNDAWKVYKQYLTSHNMAQFNKAMETLVVKYDCQPDIKGLAVWFMGRVQGLHEQYMRTSNEKRGQKKNKPNTYLSHLW